MTLLPDFAHLLSLYFLGIFCIGTFCPKVPFIYHIAFANVVGFSVNTLLLLLLAFLPGSLFRSEIYLWVYVVLFCLTLTSYLIRYFRKILVLDSLYILVIPSIFLLLWLLQENVHFVVLTYDSHRFIHQATGIVLSSGIPLEHGSLSMATGYPLPLSLVLAQGLFWGADFHRLITLFFPVSILAVFYSMLKDYLEKIDIPLLHKLFILVGFTSIILSTGLFIHFSFYINSNMLATAFLIATAGVLYLYSETYEKQFLYIAILLGVLLVMSRLEAPLYLTLLLIYSASLQTRRVQMVSFTYYTITVALSCIWLTALYLYGQGGSIISGHQLLIQICILLSFLIYLMVFNRSQAFRTLAYYVPMVITACLFIILVLFIIIKPNSMLESIRTISVNMTWGGSLWTVSWAGFLVLTVVLGQMGGFILKNAPYYFGAIFLSVLLMITDLSFFRIPYRIGFGDSGNRMLLHAFPIGWLTVAMLLANFWERLFQSEKS